LEFEWVEDRRMLAVTAHESSESVTHDQTLSDYVTADSSLGEPLLYSLSSGPSHGNVSLSAYGGFSYYPHANYVGSDSFQFQASDSEGADVGRLRST
jgi:hypothetical protein